MLVVIARHGKAQRQSETGLDRDRALRSRGFAQADFLGMALATLDTPPRRLISSPYTRARQTAERMTHILGLHVREEDRLGCGFSVGELIDVIRDNRGADCICLVGHNPTCEYSVAALTDGTTAHPLGQRTGEAVIIDLDPDNPLGSGRVVTRVRLDG